MAVNAYIYSCFAQKLIEYFIVVVQFYETALISFPNNGRFKVAKRWRETAALESFLDNETAYIKGRASVEPNDL